MMKIILYVLDALRADHLSCYGYSRETSPNIDALAKESVLFEQAFSPSTWTRPVAASLLTGVYPPVHKVQARRDVFSTSWPRLPELLQTHGYQTVGLSAMGNISAMMGFEKGFNQYFDLYKEPSLVDKRPATTGRDEELLAEMDIEVALPLAEDLNNFFLPWLQKNGSSDCFAFIWSIDTHIPYNPPDGFSKFVDSDYQGPIDGSRESLPLVKKEDDLQHLINLYDSEIYYNDCCLGKLIKKIKELGIYDDTLLIITGDHGDAFNEHERLTHGHAPYDELIHVPLIMKFPQSQYRDKRLKAMVSLLDIMPTILDLVGINHENLLLQGKSLFSLIEETVESVHDYLFSETRTWDMQKCFYGIRTQNLKYINILSPSRSLSHFRSLWQYIRKVRTFAKILCHPVYYLKRYRNSANEMLFDLQRDPDEMENLINQSPEHIATFKKQLDKWIQSCEALVEQQKTSLSSETIDFDSKTEQHLRELGYIE